MNYRYDKQACFEWLENEHEHEYYKYDYDIHDRYNKRTFKKEDPYSTQLWLQDYSLHLTESNSFQFSSKTIKEVAFKVQELVEEFVSEKPEIRKEFVSALETQEWVESLDDYKSEDYYDEDFYEDSIALFKETSRNFQKLLVAQVVEYFNNQF